MKFSRRIERYCAKNGIIIPVGFYRRSAAKFAIVRLEHPDGAPRLVARTWNIVEDVLYYLDNFAEGKRLQILDFQKGRVLERVGKRLKQIDEFEP